MGRALRARAGKGAIPPFAVAHVCTQASFGQLWRQQLRWARTIRSIDPVGYTGSVLGHPLPWALLAALVGAGSTAVLPATAVAVVAIACRMAVLRQVERTYAIPAQSYWLVAPRDLLSVAGLVGSFLQWRAERGGYPFRMQTGGS